jgi:hypothetical protein
MNYLTNYYKNLSEQLQQRYNVLFNQLKYLKEAEEEAKPVVQPDVKPEEGKASFRDVKNTPRFSTISRSEKQNTFIATENPSNAQLQWMRNFMTDLYEQFMEGFTRWFMTQLFSGRVPTTQEISQWMIQSWQDTLLQMPVWMRQTIEMGSRRWGVTVGEVWGGSWYDPTGVVSLGSIENKSSPYYIFSNLYLHPDGSVPFPWNPAGRPLDNSERDNWIPMPWGQHDTEEFNNWGEELQRLVSRGLPREWYHPQTYPD